MSDTSNNSFLPSVDVDLNLPASDSDASLGQQWDANAKTHLTHGSLDDGFVGGDYVPQHEASFPGLAQPLPQIGGEFLNGPESESAYQDEQVGKTASASPWRLASLLLVLGALVVWLVGPKFGLDIEAMILGGDEEAGEIAQAPAPAKGKAHARSKKSPKTLELEVKPAAVTPSIPSSASATATSPSQGLAPGAPAGTATMAPSPVNLASLPLPQNATIYQHLPIGDVTGANLGRVWNAEEDEGWRNGVSHRWPWQRYKTVMDVRAARLTQSTIILWDALEDPKFWTRMRAVMGLAEFGVPVAASNILKAIGNTPPQLVADFFKRFHRSTPGEQYVLRQAVGLVGPQARRNIITALLQANDPHAGLYLAAATHDGDAGMAGWASQRLTRYAPAMRQQWLSEVERLRRQPLPVVSAAPPQAPRPPLPAAGPKETPTPPAAHSGGGIEVKHLRTYTPRLREAGAAHPQASGLGQPAAR